MVGCLLVLAHEKDIRFDSRSMSILISSDVPEGKGVSSSAAVEVAVMSALVAAAGEAGAGIEGRELAILCQKVENLVRGRPSLSALLCQIACNTDRWSL